MCRTREVVAELGSLCPECVRRYPLAPPTLWNTQISWRLSCTLMTCDLVSGTIETVVNRCVNFRPKFLRKVRGFVWAGIQSSSSPREAFVRSPNLVSAETQSPAVSEANSPEPHSRAPLAMSAGLPARHRSLSSNTRPTHAQLSLSSKGRARLSILTLLHMLLPALLLLFSKGDKYGRTPLLWAAECGYEAVVKLLQSRGALSL
jgi:hypothetical protein